MKIIWFIKALVVTAFIFTAPVESQSKKDLDMENTLYLEISLAIKNLRHQEKTI